MKKLIMTLMLVCFVGTANAHEMTPTYPKLEPSHLDGLLVTTMQMFNKRAEIEYYEIAVFDKEWNPVPFVTSYNVIKIDYLGKVTFDVYIRKSDKNRVGYICSRSKLRKEPTVRTAVASRICSKFK
jgi:hypothetical protein